MTAAAVLTTSAKSTDSTHGRLHRVALKGQRTPAAVAGAAHPLGGGSPAFIRCLAPSRSGAGIRADWYRSGRIRALNGHGAGAGPERPTGDPDERNRRRPPEPSSSAAHAEVDACQHPLALVLRQHVLEQGYLAVVASPQGAPAGRSSPPAGSARGCSSEDGRVYGGWFELASPREVLLV